MEPRIDALIRRYEDKQSELRREKELLSNRIARLEEDKNEFEARIKAERDKTSLKNATRQLRQDFSELSSLGNFVRWIEKNRCSPKSTAT